MRTWGWKVRLDSDRRPGPPSAGRDAGCWSIAGLAIRGSRWKPYDVVAKVAEALAPTLDTKEVPEAAEAAVAVESGWQKWKLQLQPQT